MILLLKFKIGDKYYALNTENIAEVIPAVSLRQIPGTPTFFSGIFDYRGLIVPVIDLTQLTIGQPVTIRLSTRIILTNFTLVNGRKSILGLMAEDMTDIIDVDETAFQDTGILSQNAPYLGPIFQIDNQFIQSIELDRLLSPDIQKMIFSSSKSANNEPN